MQSKSNTKSTTPVLSNIRPPMRPSTGPNSKRPISSMSASNNVLRKSITQPNTPRVATNDGVNRNAPEVMCFQVGSPHDCTTCNGTNPKNEYLKERCKAAASNLRQLETKQKLMEASMRRLLRSMKDLRSKEQTTGFSQELDKRRRIKLTRMIQILMLQRKNMQLQNDTLRKEVITINRKFITLRKRAETLLVENINMRKFYSESKGDVDRKSIQIENLLQNKALLQKQVYDKVDLKVEVENLKFELRKLMVENHNLKESLKKADHLLKCKTQEKEVAELKNSQLTADIARFEAEETNNQFRVERLMAENDTLRQNILKCKNNNEDLTIVSYEYEKMKEKLGEMQKNYHKLERLYLQESEHRKFLHNQLQEEKGNFRVLCRVKPDAEESVWGFKGNDKIRIPEACQLPRGDEGCYTFNRVLRPEATNREIFDETKSLISSCIDGFNVCFLAYGPTGSGKTYTMQGTREDPGLTLRTIAELSDLIQSTKSVWDIQTSVCMIEIHNEVIYDLLSKCISSVRLSDDGYDVRLVDINEKHAATEQDLLFWIAKGHKRRKMAATKLNLQSSRSHLIIRISLVMQNKIDNSRRSSSLIFCDLAGSESAEKIEANDAFKVETGHINRSLVTLSRVFDCLRTQKAPIPYRDSKLTHLLKPCLGGQAKCLLIITISGEFCKVNRSIKALQFGQTAMDIAVGKIKQNTSILSCKSGIAKFK